ncbi:MAG TPA: MFS transporter [Gemmataceae bacterium]|nr:MFS transporter [Gemmataceae bacterium]
MDHLPTSPVHEKEHTIPPLLDAEPAPRSDRRAMFIVFLVVVIDLLGFGIVLPLLPYYADRLLYPLFPGGGQEAVFGVLLGLVMAAYSLMQFFFSPMWGRVSDRIGRRPILLMGLTGSVVFYTLFGLASDVGAAGYAALGLALLFASRIGGGMAGATIGTAQAVVADCTTPEKRAHGMAMIGAAFGIGFTFGPLIGFASLYLPWDGSPGYIAAALSFVAVLLGLRLLPETRKAAGGGHLRRRLLDMTATMKVLRTPVVGILVLAYFLSTFAFGGLESTLSFVNQILLTAKDVASHAQQHGLAKEAFRSTERLNFLIFAYVGFMLALMQGIYRTLVSHVGEARFLRLGVVLLTVGLLGGVAVLCTWQDMANVGWRMTAGLSVMTVAVIGFAMMNPSIQSLVSRRTDPARQGEVLGVNQSMASLARVLGPFVGMALFWLTPTHIAPYIFGALVMAAVFPLTLRIRQE